MQVLQYHFLACRFLTAGCIQLFFLFSLLYAPFFVSQLKNNIIYNFIESTAIICYVSVFNILIFILFKLMMLITHSFALLLTAGVF